MNDDRLTTVLLVCADEARAVRWIDRLYAAGCEVVGPAPTASLALTLAMHTAPSAALLVGPNVGRRSNDELALDLERLWGVPSYAPCIGRDDAQATRPGLPIVRFKPQATDCAAA